ncbi:MAG: MMPL family transporter [Myxococcales bacterium]|nr:MMPL family transporter [Myxococcales bacterium]
MTLSQRLARLWSRIVVARPGTTLVVFLALTIASAWGASKLTINTNQLDLISQDLRQVKDVKRIIDMIGGNGHLILAIRGSDPDMLKKVADDTNAWLRADTKRIRNVTYKVDVEFLRQHGALFMETPDLKEVRRRVDLKLADAKKRADPFFMEIEETKPYELKLDDLIEKYTRIGKRSITDDYYLSDDKEMLLLLVKPMWENTRLAETGELLQRIRTHFTEYNSKNAHGVKLVEDYDGKPDLDKKRVEFGFGGSYTSNYDDSYLIKSSLVPVSGFAFAGVCLVLLVFFRRHILAVLLVISGLVLGVVLTFGFAKASIGQLNMITSILGGILMGLGIDFGIHQLYRLGEELGKGEELDEALEKTVASSGVASIVSGAGTVAAFGSLTLSEFAGFSEFGVLAGAGVIIIGTALYVWVPGVLLLLERRKPGTAKKLLGGLVPSEKDRPAGRLAKPGMWLALAVLAALAVTYFAPNVRFEYNTRALMVEGQPSVLLQDEVNRRYQISSDPVGVYSRTREQAKHIYDMFTPLDTKTYSTVDQVVSMFAFVPPMQRQKANYKVLQSWLTELEKIDKKSLPPEFEKKWDEALKYVRVKPYTVDEVPDNLRMLFRNLPSAKPENKGFLTFIYPTVDLWDGKQMLAFADQIETFKTPDGEEFHSAGTPILFAKLARIVLHDARFTVLMTSILLLLLLLVDLRSPLRTFVTLLPLMLGVGSMLGAMALLDFSLNFMNVVVFPIVLGYGLSHGVYLMHRFEEGASPMEALRSVGTAVACSTLTTLAGWAALLAAAHRGMQSMGMLACLGMTATLLVTFTVMPAVMQLMHDRRISAAAERSRTETAA